MGYSGSQDIHHMTGVDIGIADRSSLHKGISRLDIPREGMGS